MTSCYLEYHFQHPYITQKSIAFENPLAILQTDDVSEVYSILQQVDEYLEQGYYIAGYMSYESAPAFHPVMEVNNESTMPLVWFGVFSHPIQPRDQDEQWEYQSFDWKPDTSREEYDRAIRHIHRSIEEGHTYQVNYTMRLHSEFTTDDYHYFHQLKQAQQANYSAYLNMGTERILSASPELFFAWDGKKIVTKPMKGTMPRGLTLTDDDQQRECLKHSKKDQSENVMIVDLLRNDLGHIAKPGSIHVSNLFDIEAYPTVFQMTSTIEADTDERTTIADIFKALFPCGSITGAPKISTMKIIHQLENSPREVYCGAIGYILPNKTAIFNVPIRTVWIDTERKIAEYGVGGGVTWESTAHGEYEETIAKGEVLTAKHHSFNLLESLLLEEGKIYLLENHLQRLKRSVDYFQFPYEEKFVRDTLESIRLQNLSGSYKLRLVLDQKGSVTVEAKEIQSFSQPVMVNLASDPVSKKEVFLYHKTTNRFVYEEKRRGYEAFYDTLLWNEDGYVTEFTNGNIVCKINNELVTPPITDGLLSGTYREILIKSHMLVERSLTVNDVKAASDIWFINSVRRWVKVRLFNGDPM